MSEPEPRISGYVLDPNKYNNQLSLGEKRELVHAIVAQWPKDAPDVFQSFTRKELLEIICAEMGKERKYTGFTKAQMIDHLIKLIDKKSQASKLEDVVAVSPTKTETGFKRQKKRDPPVQQSNELMLLPVEEDNGEENVSIQLCQNVACKATMSPNDAFCKRCSCCICHLFDDNKDPSLWLTCGSDSVNETDACGMSCHLICAMKNKKSGIMKNSYSKLDGSFCCVSCGKINGLMRIWRKQVLVAKEARRMDVLCLRVSLSQKILTGTEQYKQLQKTVETAATLLKKEVGPLDQVYTKMGRGIVKRLSCGAEVQKLCASAVEAFDALFSDPAPHYDVEKNEQQSTIEIGFEECSPTCTTIVLDYADHLLKEFLGCRVWHCTSTEKDYPDKPTFIVLRPEKRFKLINLNPSTQYTCKVSLFSSTCTFSVSEAKWVTPPSTSFAEVNRMVDQTTTVQNLSLVESTNSSDIKIASGDRLGKQLSLHAINKNKYDKFSSGPLMEAASLPSPGSVSPPTPCKVSGTRGVAGSGCKRQADESGYDHCVRMVKWLERDGHIDEDFRVKFLTWFSLKATAQERRVVGVFVDAMMDDPPSLAGQLIHTFADQICPEHKPNPQPQPGFCTRFWH